MKRPSDRWLIVKAVCASRVGCRRTVSTTLVTKGTRDVMTPAAAAMASPSRWRWGECDTVARSVNSSVQIESGQKLTM